MRNATKIFAMLILIALSISVLASCGIVTSGDYKFGLATVETDNSAVAAAVILDASDRIALVRIDEIENGKTRSKADMGDAYGMVAYGGAALEWYEQIANLERALIGKNLDEILGTTGEDADIKAGCTVYIGNYLTAVAKAVEAAMNSEESFKSTVDHLGLVLNVIAGASGSDGEHTVAVAAAALNRGTIAAKDARFIGAVPSAHKLGLATVDTSDGKVAAAVVTDASGRIVAVEIDEIANGSTQSKGDLGDSYNMLTYGGAIAEWYQQIDHLESTLIGKNREQVGIVDGADADIVTGCTIYIGNYKQAVLLAIDNAATSSAFNAIAEDIVLELDLGVDADSDFVANAKVTVKGSKVAEKSSGTEPLRFAYATLETSDGLVAAAVVINADGKLVLVKIDEIANGSTLSKGELGDSYNMVNYGGAIAEWYEQINHLESTLIGKSAEQITGIDASDADLVAGCTIYIGNYTQAVINAITAAKAATSFDANVKNIELSLSFAVSGDGFTVSSEATVS